MTHQAEPDDPTDLLTSHGFTFADEPEPTRTITAEPDDDLTDDPDFQPRPPRRYSRLTLILIGLIILGIGFLLGVLADRAISAMMPS